MKKYVTPELAIVLMNNECICSTSNLENGTMNSSLNGGWEWDYFKA